MEQPGSGGYREREHTADWALDVWGPDLPALFLSAARGMNSLMGIRLAAEPAGEHSLSLQAPDPESLLVSFLSELLYLEENEGLGFGEPRLALDPGSPGHPASLRCTGSVFLVVEQSKEIKAVTFHNLKIRSANGQWSATIVFDV